MFESRREYDRLPEAGADTDLRRSRPQWRRARQRVVLELDDRIFVRAYQHVAVARESGQAPAYQFAL
jgi:hypothetical protein